MRMIPCAVIVGLLLGSGTVWAQQTLTLTVGGFVPLGEDARVSGDVLIENRRDLFFAVSDFTGPTIGGEYLAAVGEFLEVGAGIGFYRRSVDTVYERLVDSDGTEIDQTLRLRVVPVAFTVRLVAFGHSAPVQPYVGGGLGIFSWRYSEVGEFVAVNDAVFRDRFVASGFESGPVILGGVRFVGDAAVVGGEIRYRRAEAPLGNDFTGPVIDLGGWTYQATFGLRF